MGILSGTRTPNAKSAGNKKASIGMKTTGGRDMDRSGGTARVAKATEQPSKKNRSMNPGGKRTSGFVR